MSPRSCAAGAGSRCSSGSSSSRPSASKSIACFLTGPNRQRTIGGQLQITDDDGTLTGVFPVTADGLYRIELAAVDGHFVTASPQYTIDALADSNFSGYLVPGHF